MIEEHKETEKTSYFNFDNSYVESEEENDEDLEKSGNETDDTDSDNEQPDVHKTYKCNDCNFEGKNVTGLKMHMKGDHKIKCNSCGYRTTTKPLFKKHMKDIH